MKPLLAPLVGAYYHPPAALIIPLLAAGTKLILESEPDNMYDPDAIIVRFCPIDVGFDITEIPGEALMSMGLVYDDLKDRNIMLGYIARQRSESHPRGPAIGNTAALALINSGPNWQAALAFALDGRPLVRLELITDSGIL